MHSNRLIIIIVVVIPQINFHFKAIIWQNGSNQTSNDYIARKGMDPTKIYASHDLGKSF